MKSSDLLFQNNLGFLVAFDVLFSYASESQQRRCLEQNLKESERKLAQEHLDHTLEK